MGIALPLAAQSAKTPASATATEVTGVEDARLVETIPLDGTLYHVQGVDLDRDHIWVTSVDQKDSKAYLHQFSRATHKLERRVDLTDGPRFHPGGFSIDKDSIWVPVAEYKRNSSAVLIELDKRTLAVKRRIAVPDHIGCVAVTKDSLVAGNWDSRQFYVLDKEGRQIRKIDNPSATSYQDIKFVDGDLVGSGNTSATSGALEWFTWPSMKLVRRLRAGVTDRGEPYTNEGMALKGRNLYLLPENGPSRLFHFVLATP
ncbi:MAG TPA: DUF6454 family protein [Edaphobacter sp.]|nr:DUF6454 family protein [Edaphobacter sp.]